MSYEIKVDLISGLPKTPYRNGVGAYEGVCMHDTECRNDSDESETKYFEDNWQTRQAFVHYFVDDDSITQNADLNYKSWGCGNGNSRFVNIELCNTDDAVKFNEGYQRWVWLAAKLLHDRKLGVVDGVTLVSHNWVSHNLGGTTHSDPIGYLATHKKTWANVVEDVKKAYAAFDVKPVVTPIPKPVITAPKTAINGKLVEVICESLNVHKTPDFNASSVVSTVHKGEVFTILRDCGEMYQLKSGLYITKSTKYVKVK